MIHLSKRSNTLTQRFLSQAISTIRIILNSLCSVSQPPKHLNRWLICITVDAEIMDPEAQELHDKQWVRNYLPTYIRQLILSSSPNSFPPPKIRPICDSRLGKATSSSSRFPSRQQTETECYADIQCPPTGRRMLTLDHLLSNVPPTLPFFLVMQLLRPYQYQEMRLKKTSTL